ncbi:MAG TPA: hypothetical protein VNY84_14370 [Acidimicrobiales bacterium]|jgi:hypothetical protein|nr:hypothetical protein [Acidimicrobiales bacterium]
MGDEGQCPTCGQVIAPPSPSTTSGNEGAVVAHPATPWHFKLMLVALVIYLGFRAFQGVAWLVAHA